MKKAQGGLNAAMLMAVIGGLIIAYIIFLPAEEREALLENKSIEDVRRNGGGSSDEDVLLKEFPGRLDTVEDIDDKEISNVFLFETTNAKELERINPFIIRNGWFDKKSKSEVFSISDLGNTDNVLLSFQTTKSNGILTIKLNGETIFESALAGGSVNPIKIKKQSLHDENTLTFSVSSVGMKFWSTNEYQFEDVRLIADVTDKSNQKSTSIFTLTTTELFNAEEANLRFVPYCESAEQVGTLNVDINGRNVFSAIPVCEDAYKQPVPLGLLKAGQNTITMKTARGSYSVEQIRVEFDEEDIKSNVYFFEINESHLDDIEDDKDNVILRLRFVEDEELKRADINVNDKFFTLDQEEETFTEDITNVIEEGNNFVEIIPRNTIDVREITVTIEEDD